MCGERERCSGIMTSYHSKFRQMSKLNVLSILTTMPNQEMTDLEEPNNFYHCSAGSIIAMLNLEN